MAPVSSTVAGDEEECCVARLVIHLFIHSFKEYVVGTYYVLGSCDVEMNTM